MSPNIVSGAHPSGYPRFDSYISSLKGEQLTVRGTAMGKNYRYTGTFADDPHDPNGPGSIRLTDQGPDHLAPMYVKGSSLAGNSSNDTNGIYGNNSPYYVDGTLHSGNDVYGAVYRDLVAGFAYGFWGSPAYGNDQRPLRRSALHPVRSKAPSPTPRTTTCGPRRSGRSPTPTASRTATRSTTSPTAIPIVELPTDGTLKITIDPDTSPAGCAGGTTPSPTPTPTPTITDSDAHADHRRQHLRQPPRRRPRSRRHPRPRHHAGTDAHSDADGHDGTPGHPDVHADSDIDRLRHDRSNLACVPRTSGSRPRRPPPTTAA
ncbi:MAG: hypothetical protein V9E98_07560 [Candidatus Nanopelagicales bacterium]